MCVAGLSEMTFLLASACGMLLIAPIKLKKTYGFLYLLQVSAACIFVVLLRLYNGEQYSARIFLFSLELYLNVFIFVISGNFLLFFCCFFVWLFFVIAAVVVIVIFVVGIIIIVVLVVLIFVYQFLIYCHDCHHHEHSHHHHAFCRCECVCMYHRPHYHWF
jgi:hypothetical protein